MARIISISVIIFFFSATVFAQGGWQWGRGSIGNNVAAWPIATDIFGNEFVAGISSGPISFDNNNPSFVSADHQCVLAKYDDQGDFLWARYTEKGPNTYLISITTDLTGNCYLLGWLADSSMEIGSFTLHNATYPNAQYFIAKYNSAGDVLWAKNAGGKSGYLSAPPIVLDSVSTVNIVGLGALSSDKDRNIYVATGFNLPSTIFGSDTVPNTSAGGGTDDILLVKYDSTGNVVWAKTSGGTGDDIPFSLVVTPSGAIYVAGIFNSDSAVFGPSVIKDTSTSIQKWNGFIARYDPLGNAVWADGSGGGGKEYTSGIASDLHSNVYITGGTNDSSISFGGSNIVNDSGKPVLYIVKFDTANGVAWNKTIVSPDSGADWGYGIATSGNTVWVSGAFSKKILADNQYLDTPAASVDPVFIANVDSLGYYIRGAALQSGAAEQSELACDKWGAVYLCGDYKYPCSPFIIGDNVLANVSLNEHWLYLAKYAPGGPGDGLPIIYNNFDITMCPYDSVLLRAPYGYELYHWSNGSSDTILNATDSGTYWVTGMGTNNMEVDSFRIKIDPELCDCTVFLPTAFTPQGDGKNDTYGPVFRGGCYISRYAFSIYNRWGQRVFYSEDPYEKWDGTYHGVKAELDVYMYYLMYATNPSYPEHTKKGDVTLVR